MPPPSIWRAPSPTVLQLLESVRSLPDTRHNAQGVALALLPSDPSLLVVFMHRGDRFGTPRPDVHVFTPHLDKTGFNRIMQDEGPTNWLCDECIYIFLLVHALRARRVRDVMRG
mmetsp:Transcript_49668/g.116283  ORF Transcript_49668/g.116283 Transcript_49668/m.116283 type:complete len:114 (+) Transcript_49668:253-594(+)